VRRDDHIQFTGRRAGVAFVPPPYVIVGPAPR